MKKFDRLKSAVLSGILAVSSVAGSLSAVAPSLSASAADSDNYAKLLQYSLYFYDANMCGDDVADHCGLSWRGNCHTNDEVPGGFHDAGDHAMFGQPQGYTASTLGWAYYEFKDAFDGTGQTEHLKLITDRFAKFFRDCTVMNGNTVQKVLIEKGDGNTDHAYWGPPEKQGDRGRMLWTTGGAANITFQYAAALAVNYINFGNPDDLKYAKALYDFSMKDTGYYACEFYDGHWTGSKDEMAWAAGWLYLATNDNSYLQVLKNGPASYSNHSWESVELGAGILKGEITGDWSNAGFMDNFTGSNYCFLQNWEWGSARQNCTAQFITLVAAKYKQNTSEWAKGQMEYITGDKAFQNGQKHCLVVGLKSDSPQNAHHRAASGYSSYDEMGDSTTAKAGSPVLVGALVGGPADASGTYTDSIKDYTANEVALDYNAGFVGAAAGLYHFYKTGSIESTIPGVTKIYSGNGSTYTPATTTAGTPAVTTQAPATQTPTVTTATPSSGNGGYTITPGEKIEYGKLPKDDKMIGWKWKDFGIGKNEKPTKVEINISSANGKDIGKWQGAFGSSTTVDPGYWTQTDDMQQVINGSKGTITWNIDSATSKIIQTQYGGQLKWGIWWVDCQDIVVDSITVYTDASSSTTPVVTTQAPAVTTKTPSVTTATPSSSSNGGYTITPGEKIEYGKLPKDDKMIGWKWKDFGIGKNEKPTKVEINISSANGKDIGKWQGAFGSSTTVDPDYWTQTDDMQQVINGSKGTITWNIDSATSKIIQTQYGGQLKWGIWWVDCQDIVVDSITVYTDGSSSSTPVVTTQAPSTTQRPTVTTATPSSSGNGGYTITPGEKIEYGKLPKDDKMIGWKWKDFGIGKNEKPTKVEINISSANGKDIGKWQGAFGSSTTVDPDYWTQTDDMQQVINGSKGTITWNIDSATSKIIQTQYGGQLKWGIWWVDCQDIVVDSITVYTDGSSKPVTTTAAPTTTAKPTTTKPATTTTANDGKIKAILPGDANCDGDVSAADATTILQALGNPDKYALTEQGKANADVYGNGDGVTALDALTLQKVDAGVLSLSDLPVKN